MNLTLPIRSIALLGDSQTYRGHLHNKIRNKPNGKYIYKNDMGSSIPIDGF